MLKVFVFINIIFKDYVITNVMSPQVPVIIISGLLSAKLSWLRLYHKDFHKQVNNEIATQSLM